MKSPGVNVGSNDPRKLQKENYITVTYGSFANYSEGFNPRNSDIREGTTIFINDQEVSSFVVNPNESIEIHFSSPKTSMALFFVQSIDSNANKISSVDFSHFDSSAVNNALEMFHSCTSLKEVNFTNFDASRISIIDRCFYNCENLETVDFSNFNAANLQSMESMFDGCSKLTSLNLSAFNTKKVIFMAKLFNNCKSLKTVDLSSFITTSVGSMAYMFNNCSQLTSLDLSGFVTSNIVNYNNMFSGCSQLTSLNLSTFHPVYVEEMNNMFNGCDSLEYLDISNFVFSFIDASQKVFNGIGNLKYLKVFNVTNMLKLTSEDLSNLRNINDLIVCQNEIILNSSEATYCCCDLDKNPIKCDCDNYLTVKYKGKTEYTEGFINDGINSRNEISFIINQNKLFKKSESFIIEEDNFINIYFKKAVTGLQNFFNVDFDIHSKNISYVDFSNFNSSLLTNTYQMFQDCNSIKEINFENFKSSSIKITSRMFSGCSQLTSLDLSNFDTSSVSNMREMFTGCSFLEYLDISNFDTGLLESFSNMFNGADNIKYINLLNIKNINALTEAISGSSNLNTKNDLTVCKNEDIVINENAIYECCDYWDYNFETLCCETLIIIL